MNQTDIFYRALIEYRKHTADNRECKNERKAVAASCPESDLIETQRTLCTIDEDWIIAIEEGLVHIEKAINEGRQFIQSRGDVVPIEKVKRVSKDSVEHLSKHSDLITRMPKDDADLIPDKLYIVERLSDFAVYENRFLYLLLSYLKSFISHRYNKILEKSNTYNGSVSMNKTIAVNNRKISFELKLTDERKNDKYMQEINPLKPIIARIDLILRSVMHFLGTPLMQEVSKVPMLKPPITKTNVLKMNRNFKGAVALYDFVTAYEKQGYTEKYKRTKITPLPDDAADEFAEVVMLTSFLTYKYGMDLKKPLKIAYDEEEKLRRETEEERKKEQLLQLKRRVKESGYDPSEYILMLEKHNKALEQDSVQLIAAKKENEKLNSEIVALNENINSLSYEMEKSATEIGLLNEKLSTEIDSLNNKFHTEIDDLKVTHKQDLEELASKLISVMSESKAKIEALQSQHNETVKNLVADNNETVKNLVADNDETVKKLLASNNELEIKCERLLSEKTTVDSRFMALRIKHNLISKDEDFTNKATFDELEEQLNAFKAFFKDEWKKAKKKIKKNILEENNKKNLKADDKEVLQEINSDTSIEENEKSEE